MSRGKTRNDMQIKLQNPGICGSASMDKVIVFWLCNDKIVRWTGDDSPKEYIIQVALNE